MATEYVLAGLYNIISTLGGRGLSLSADGDDGEGAELAAAFESAFGIDADAPAPVRLRPSRQCLGAHGRGHRRPGSTPGAGRSGCSTRRAVRSASAEGHAIDTGHRGAVRAWPPAAWTALRICGMDIGGTDIKLCLAVDGRVVRFLEYDWFPAAFTQIDQIIDPILALVRLMRLDGGAGHRRRRHGRARRGARRLRSPTAPRWRRSRPRCSRVRRCLTAPFAPRRHRRLLPRRRRSRQDRRRRGLQDPRHAGPPRGRLRRRVPTAVGAGRGAASHS